MPRSTSPSGISTLLPVILILLTLRACVGTGPINPPDPPAPVKELLVLIVEESSQRTAAQADLIQNAALRARLAALGHRLRVVDQHAQDWDNQPARVLGPWRALLAASPGPSRVPPWVLFVRSDGSVLFDASLASFASAAELQAKVESLTAQNGR